ncbi:MAG TPA: phosphoribosylformylglycinamidine synthase subunit PurS [Candidatus Binatia bacterium]|nr:phosphoribosylformylglycinamidine synthase subunit PurS [Candidatus Binatia bacterium]
MSHVARVLVTPKPVVNDPQGQTVRQGLASLGFREVSEVRIGKYIEVTLDAPSREAAAARVEEMCRSLLANHVIEDFRFEIVASSTRTLEELPEQRPPAAGFVEQPSADEGWWQGNGSQEGDR